MPIGPSFKQLQILRLFDGVYYYKPGSSPQLKKNLLINHFCAKKQILSRYSQSAWLLSILGKFHHISPTLNAILPRQTVPYEKTPRIEYIYIYIYICEDCSAGRSHRKTVGRYGNHPPSEEVRIAHKTRKIHHPNRTNSWFRLKTKKDPSFKEMFFSTLGESKHCFYVKHLNFLRL